MIYLSHIEEIRKVKWKWGRHVSAFYTRMKAYREKFDLSQRELADKVGVRRETIVRLEKGQYNPSLKLAIDIARLFDASVEDVFVFEQNNSEELGGKYL